VSASVADRFATDARAGVTASTIPWPLYAVVLASTCIVVGLNWDVSWHRTVGRDTFWTLAHVLEQLAAVIAGLSCGWIVLRTTFGGSAEAKAESVRFRRALVFLAMTLVLPGSAQLVRGNKVVGRAALRVDALLGAIAVGGYAYLGRAGLIRMALKPWFLAAGQVSAAIST